MFEVILSCRDLEDLGMWTTSCCCDSCHDDVAYGYPLTEGVLPDGRKVEVCCRCEPWDATAQKSVEIHHDYDE